MKKYVELQGRNIEYVFCASRRARSIRLAIYPEGALVVTAPQSVSESKVTEFIFKKSDWIIGKLEYFKRQPATIFVKVGRNGFAQYKEQARLLAESRVLHFNQTYHFRHNRISIKNQKTRWGSASKQGNLNFNYKIALLPKHFSDYIIVHELCHLGVFNHSPKFWALVAQTIPDYLTLRRELKTIKFGRPSNPRLEK